MLFSVFGRLSGVGLSVNSWGAIRVAQGKLCEKEAIRMFTQNLSRQTKSDAIGFEQGKDTEDYGKVSLRGHSDSNLLHSWIVRAARAI
jgi:hypothetical protein